MKKNELIKGVSSSILGFGCAPILGSIDTKKAARAIDIALDCGVNHFDLARSYGYGEAESFVGKQLGAKRKDVVLVSKFGIQANWKSVVLKPLKPIVRALKSKRNHINLNIKDKEVSTHSISDVFLERLKITPESMLSSLNKTLKSLRTDYLDILMIHEPLNTVENLDLILALAEKLKTDGKIKGIGLAFMQNQFELHRDYISGFDLLQFNNSPGLESYNTILKNRGGEKNIFFSPLNGGNQLLSAENKLNQLFTDFPQSTVLCSMFKEEHIRSNVNIALKF